MKWLYTCYDLDWIAHQIVAKSKQDAKKQLLAQGKVAIRIELKSYIGLNSFNQHELLIISKQLATLLKAGLPIVESLSLLAKEHTKPNWRSLLNDVKTQLITGLPLSHALEKYHTILPSLYREIIATGELTGQLDKSFEQAAFQLEKTLQLQKRIKKALQYPLFLILVAVIVTLIMLLVVLPKFSDVYASFDAKLPSFTQGLIDVADYFKQQYQFILRGCPR